MQRGLRERKKERTKRAIVDAALRLFDERGFEATTIADIAAAADIAPRTFFGYFASKEEVLFSDASEILASFSAALDERPAEQTAFDALRTWFAEYIEREPAMAERDRITDRCRAEVPAIAARELAIRAKFEALIARGVARDLGLDEPDHRALMVAASTMTAFQVLGDAKNGADQSELLAMLSEVTTFVSAGLEALRRP